MSLSLTPLELKICLIDKIINRANAVLEIIAQNCFEKCFFSPNSTGFQVNTCAQVRFWNNLITGGFLGTFKKISKHSSRRILVNSYFRKTFYG